MMRDYKIVAMNDRTGKPISAIRFDDSPFNGLLFSYGKVELIGDEDADEAVLKFEYDIHQDSPESYDKGDLHVHLGDFLTSLMLKQLGAGELVYKGGVDAERPIRD